MEMNKNLIETLPKDVIEKITKELSPQDFVKFCSNNYTVCNSNDVFYRRFMKDFPFIKNLFDDWNTNSKQRYLEIFQKFSKVAEDMTQIVLNEFENISKYMNSEYKQDVYKFLFNMLIAHANDSFADVEIDIDSEFLYDKYYIDSFNENFIPMKARDNADNNEYFWTDFLTLNSNNFMKSLSNNKKFFVKRYD